MRKEMGRVRVQIKKIENKTYRHITFAKRKNGLLKKAYEISTLCDVELALIIFSPAGKLILFHGNKRLAEIFMHYIDLPQHQRGRLRDQELVRRLIAQMSLEAELCHHLASNNRDRDMTMSIDSQLQEIEKEICIRSAELENVEKQLQYFLKSPSCIKSASEAKFLEGILENTLKLVSMHKIDLEANNNIKLTISEKQPIHPQSADASSLIMGSSNYWTPQYDTTANHFCHSAQFQSLRNESSQLLAEVLPSTYPNLSGIAVSSSDSRPQYEGYICQMPHEYKFFNNAHFSRRVNNIQQGRTSTDNEQNKTADATQHLDCGLPFPY